MNKEKLAEEGLVPGYFVLVGFFALACMLLFLSLMMMNINKHLRQKSEDLRVQERRYAYSVLQTNAVNVRESAQRLSLQKYDTEDAARAILTYADYLFNRYGASIHTDIIAGDGRMVVGIKMSKTPADVYDFVACLYDLLSRKEPTTFIDSMSFKYNRPTKPEDILPYTVEFDLRVAHPFYEGEK